MVQCWYDSGNYGILWAPNAANKQIFLAGRDMIDMVEIGRDDELFTLGSMNAAEQFIAVSSAMENEKSTTSDDNETIIGLAIMGIALLSLVIIAAVFLKKRSTRKNGGKNVANLNSAFQDHDEEFHDEPYSNVPASATVCSRLM